MLRRGSAKLLKATVAAESSVPCIAVVTQRNLASSLLGGDHGASTSWGQHSGSNSQFWGQTRGFSASGMAHALDKDLTEDSPQAGGAALLDEGVDELMGPDSISHAVGAAEIGALAESWDEAYFLNKGFQFLIQSFHSATGTPWWQSIAVATVVCRVLTIPLVIKQIGNTARMSKAKPELQQLATWFKEKQAEGTGQDYQKEYMMRMAQLWEKHDCHPVKSLLPIMAQAPIFIGFFGALRSMAAAKVPSMMVGGPDVAWYADLTVADPYYTLPVLSSLIFLISIELNAADGMQGQDEATLRRMKNWMRGLAVVMVPFTASMPMSVFCYWITSNFYSLIQSSVMKLQPVRKFLKLPPLVASQVGMATSATSLASTATGQPVQSFSTRPPSSTSKPKQSIGHKPATTAAPPKRRRLRKR